MTNIIEILHSYPDFLGGSGSSNETIVDAENRLNLRFSQEYREYLQTFGVAMFGGHEFTGISKSSRTNVVDVTLLERTKNALIPNSLYVIEETNIDGIVIMQNESGEIFFVQPHRPPTKEFDSLVDFIKACS